MRRVFLRFLALLFVAAVGVLLLAGGCRLCATTAHAHDSWISRQGLRNSAGEWCCGEGDCFVLKPSEVSIRADGYHLIVRQLEDGKERLRAEIVPFAEAQPSPDGAYWRCKRPDGTRRCFFAPPPNT